MAEIDPEYEADQMRRANQYRDEVAEGVRCGLHGLATPCDTCIAEVAHSIATRFGATADAHSSAGDHGSAMPFRLISEAFAEAAVAQYYQQEKQNG